MAKSGASGKVATSVASLGSDHGLKVPTPNGVQVVPPEGGDVVGQRPIMRESIAMQRKAWLGWKLGLSINHGPRALSAPARPA